MSRRKPSRRRARQGALAAHSLAGRPPAQPAQHASPSALDASPTLFYAPVPLGDPQTAAMAWLRLSLGHAVRVSVCLGCGARYEEVVAAPGPLKTMAAVNRFTARVRLPSAAMRRFAVPHRACATTFATACPTVVGCRESLWNVPTLVPAHARFWTDEMLDGLLRQAADGPHSQFAVLARGADGAEVRRAEPTPPLPADVPDDAVEFWMRGHLDHLIAGVLAPCGGALEAVLVVLQGTQASTVDGVPTVGGAFVVTAQGAFAGLLPADVDVPTADGLKDSILVWQPLTTPSALFDGLFAVPSL